jgi:hypothetical protein
VERDITEDGCVRPRIREGHVFQSNTALDPIGDAADSGGKRSPRL